MVEKNEGVHICLNTKVLKNENKLNAYYPNVLKYWDT